MPGSTFSRLVAFDGLIHGWGLATSTQQEWDPPEDVVAEVDAFARQAIAPEMRDGTLRGSKVMTVLIAARADGNRSTPSPTGSAFTAPRSSLIFAGSGSALGGTYSRGNADGHSRFRSSPNTVQLE